MSKAAPIFYHLPAKNILLYMPEVSMQKILPKTLALFYKTLQICNVRKMDR